jgi:hypothetical protein
MATFPRPSVMTLAIGAVSALLVVGVVWPYLPSRGPSPGDLSGDLYVMMQSGDVKRAGDVEVRLVPSTQALIPAWQALRTEYGAAVAVRIVGNQSSVDGAAVTRLLAELLA